MFRTGTLEVPFLANGSHNGSPNTLPAILIQQRRKETILQNRIGNTVAFLFSVEINESPN